MNPRFSNQRNHALTLVEVLVTICAIAFLAVIFLSSFFAVRQKAARVNCVNNLKRIGLAYRAWEGYHGDKYPMNVPATNGGAMELAAIGDVAATFQVVSNELSTPKLLLCPADTKRIEAANFNDLNGKISYFINVNATESFPDMPVFGDDNFAINGFPVKSGLLELSSNAPISWTSARHKFVGNISFADGSITEFSNSGLLQALEQTGPATNATPLSQQPMLQEALQAHNGVATNRLAIP
ncbi:MAG TPA: hypothetical protein VII71_07560 [Verrucomicrobiae bacterium]